MTDESLNQTAGGRANHATAQGPVLLGVKRRGCRTQTLGRALGRKLAERGEIAYWVASPEERSSGGPRANQRAHARARTRLRSAKLLGEGYRFLCEGRICDQSCDGLRLALSRDVFLPAQLAVHIDETSEVREAELVWRRGSTIGIRLYRAAPTAALRPCVRHALKERYYAIPG
jgi:hypothetical protein